jgi:hypothetical protein
LTSPTAANGHHSQFTADGLMALYGLDSEEPATGVVDALHGAREMLARIDRLNGRLRGELLVPRSPQQSHAKPSSMPSSRHSKLSSRL